jgi:SAM-dependent methyltransferase
MKAILAVRQMRGMRLVRARILHLQQSPENTPVLSLQRTAKELIRHWIVKTGATRLLILARKARGQNVDHLLERSSAARFEAIYRNAAWRPPGSSGSLSGIGSEIENTASIRAQLPRILESLRTHRLLDVGCGDFTWMKELDLPCDYIGVDIVASVIETNRALYESPARKFYLLDATVDPLPDADTVICREMLFHLSFDDVSRFLANIKKSRAKYLIATNDTSTEMNSDIISGDFRLLNLLRRPFSFPPPMMSIDDDAIDPGRMLSVWRVDALP